MSQQDNTQDFQDPSSAPQAETWPAATAANRPAEGATRVASLHQAEQTWSAGEGATDFLGLEQEAQGESAGVAPAQAADAEAGAEANPTQAWLFHMENEARTQTEPSARPAVAAPEWSAEALLDGQDTASAVEGAPPVDARELEQGVQLGDLPPAQEALVQEALAAPARSRKVQWLVAAGLLATLLAAGGWQVWHGKSKVDQPSDPLVWRSGSKTQKPKPGQTPEHTQPSETPTVAQTPPAPPKPVVAETPPVEQPPPAIAQDPSTQPETPPVEVAATDPQPADPQPSPAPDVPLAQTTPPPEVPAPADFTPVPFSGTRPEDPVAALATPKGARRPDPSEIAGLWTDAAIPFDAIGADSVLRTPRVGAVRVLLKNGEHLQGRLHSVGQGHVSMDVSLGRMSVDYSEVREIVQIKEADLSKLPSNGLPEETAGLMYITAKVPGGFLTGWLVQRTEGKLTLITEQAKKVTFDDEGFEPVSKGRARVVGSLGGDTAEAGSPAPVTKAAAPATKGSAPAKKSPSPAAKAPAASKPAKPKG